jgi:hypothetical protein
MAQQLSLFVEPTTDQLPLFEEPSPATEPTPEPSAPAVKNRMRFLALDDVRRPRHRHKQSNQGQTQKGASP